MFMKIYKLGIFACTFVLGLFLFSTPAFADTHIWDGDGGDNNWSTCANWDMGDTCPDAGDTVQFDATSTKASTIDSSFGGTIAVININSGYTGEIAQGRSLTVNTITQADGTFTGGAYDIDMATGFTLTGGVFTAPSETFYIAGDFAHTVGGTFNHNNGTVVFDGHRENWTFSNPSLATSGVFYNLTMDTLNTGGSYISINNTNITVEGDLVLINGRFAAYTNNENIFVSGDVTVGPWDDYSLADPDIVFVGVEQNLDLTGYEDYLDQPISIGDGVATPTVTLLSDFTMDYSGQSLNIVSGTLDVGTNTLALDNGTGGYITVSGGTLEATNGVVDVGNLTITDGVFEAPSGTMTISGILTHTAGGEFRHNNGSVVWDGTGSKAWGLNAGVDTSGEFYDLTIDCLGVGVECGGSGNYISHSGDIIYVEGDLAYRDGRVFNGIAIEVQGDFTVSPGWNPYDNSDTPIYFTGSAEQQFDLTGAEAVMKESVFVNKSGGSVEMLSGINMAANFQSFIVEEGELNLNGQDITMTSFGGNFNVEDGGVFVWVGTETLTLNGSDPDLASGSTVRYSGATADTDIQDWDYHHLRFSDSSSNYYRLGAIESIAGNLTIDSDAYFDLRGYDLTVTGTISNEGRFQLQGGETITGTLDVDSGEMSFTGDNDAAADTYTITDYSATYNNLRLNSADGVTDTFLLGEALDINNQFTTNRGTLDTSSESYQVTLGGSWGHDSVNFAFTPRPNTFVIDDVTKTTQISGGPSVYHLTCTTPGKTIQFFEGQTMTVNGDLTLTGSDGNLITLRSTSDETQWGLSVAGTSTVTYVDVKDSDASGSAEAIDVSDGTSVDSENNTNWTFPSTSSGGPALIITEIYTITLTSPNGGETVPLGESYAITWTSSTNIDSVNVYFSDDNGRTYQIVATGEGNDGEYTWTVPETAITTGKIKVDGLKTGSIKAFDVSDSTFEIAVVEIEEAVEEEEVIEEPTVEGNGETYLNPYTGEEEEVSAVEEGMWIKSAYSNTVYYIDADLVRHPVPNAQTFYTYEDSFDVVEVVTGATMPTLTLGSPMLPKEGVVLVKIQSDPKVYWIDEGNVLRWIHSEEIAIALFGEEWADYVIDIEPTYMNKFSVGEDVDEVDDIIVDIDAMIKREDLV
jgi:hypothetical protein